MYALGIKIDPRILFHQTTQIIECALSFSACKKDSAGLPTRRGGYFCLAKNEPGVPLLVTLIGAVPESKQKKYFDFAIQKAKTLSEFPHCVSDFQTHLATEKDFPYGAVCCDMPGISYILSFSGLPAAWDEACMLLLGRKLDLLSEDRVKLVTQLSNNMLVYQMLSRKFANWP